MDVKPTSEYKSYVNAQLWLGDMMQSSSISKQTLEWQAYELLEDAHDEIIYMMQHIIIMISSCASSDNFCCFILFLLHLASFLWDQYHRL